MSKLPPSEVLEVHTRTILDIVDPLANHIKFCKVFEELREVWKDGHRTGIDDCETAIKETVHMVRGR